MFGKPIPLFSLLGFQVRLDFSWFIIAALVTWSLAGGVFPQQYPSLSPATYWTMGLVGAFGLFASIVLHELAHSVVARQFDMPMRGITLFIFGGVAEMTKEPPSAKAEFFVAIAGPIASAVIALICGVTAFFVPPDTLEPVSGVLWYVTLMNVMLVMFNLVPAFPLDGGRVLRSMLWHFKGNLRWATRITAGIGSAFGLFLIFMGVMSFLSGYLGGLWWFLIGLFLRNAASMSYQQLIIRRALEGEPVAQFMTKEVQTVPPETTIRDFVDHYVYAHHHKMFPVTQNGDLLGCITTRKVKELDRSQWDQFTVSQLASPCSEENTLSPNADAMDALARMNQSKHSRLMVVENGHLRGIVSLKDLLNFISLKVELEED